MEIREVTQTTRPLATAIRLTLSGIAALPLLAGMAPQALAQGKTMQLEEMVVTATRRDAGLQDVGASMNAIGGEDLDRRGITNFDSIKQAASGLYLEVPANSSSSSLRVRGVGTAGNTGIDPSVGVIVDGVYQMFPGTVFSELMDVERIEVLRGPQGTLFGRNTTAGVIQINTRDPQLDEVSGHVQGVVGNLNNRELRGTVNLPLVTDTLAVRISGNTVRRDGHNDNTYLDRDARGQDREGGRIKLLWRATDALDISLNSSVQTTDTTLTEGLIEYGNDNLLPSSHPLRGQSWSTLAGLLGKTLPDVSLGEAAQNYEGLGEDRTERHILTIDWDLPGHTLKSVSAYEEHDIFIAQDRDRTILDMSDLTADSGARVLTQELILSSEGDGAWSYLVGAFYQTEDLTTDIVINNGADYTTLMGGFVIPSTYVVSDRNNSSVAGFASTTYEFTDVLRGTLGVRYTEDTKEMRQQMEVPFTGTVVPMDSKKTFREWTYAANLQYDIDEDKMVYVAYDVGFKSGGFNQQNVNCILSGGTSGCLSDDRLSFDPETTDSLQLGLKSEWLDGRVRLNGALFYQTYEDYQVAEYLQEQAYLVVSNAAKVESKGIEFDLNAVLTDHLRLDASVTYADSRYDSFDSAPCSKPSQPGCVNGAQDLSGKRLDNAPRLTSNLSLTYQNSLPVEGWSWFVRGDAIYRSATNLYSVQDEGNDQGGYTLFNARLGIETDDGQWRATMWGNNLGDKEFAQTGISDLTGVMMIRGLTRTYGLTVDWHF